MKDEFVQTPTANVIEYNKMPVLVLTDWNVEHEMSGYSIQEVKQLINMLTESLTAMNRYNEAQQPLPLFEKVGDLAHVQQENQQPFPF